MDPVSPTEEAKQRNVGKPKLQSMIPSAHRGIVRDAIRDFGFGGVTITGGDLATDVADTRAKIDASTDDLERGVLYYGLGQLHRKHDDCVTASKHWMEGRKLVLAATKAPLDSEQARKRREQAFRFYGRIMIGEAYCDLQTGRAAGAEQKVDTALRNLFGVGDAERAEAWFASGIALVEGGDTDGGKEMLQLAARRGSAKLRDAVAAYAAALGVKL